MPRPRRGAGGAAGQARAEDAGRRRRVVAEIRAVLAACPFHGEGYRKVRARLAHRGLAVSGKRVLRLMRPHGLLAPRRLGPPNGNPAHDGTITTDAPGRDVGDRRDPLLHRGGRAGAGSSAPSITTSTRSWAGTRPRSAIGGRRSSRFARACATPSDGSARTWRAGLALRCDWGPQYIADAWINEVKWLGCTISPSYVGEPECNGVAERFMRTLKEQCIYLHQFREPRGGAADHRPSSSRATTPSGSSSGWGIERRRKRVRMPSGGPHERR